MNIIFNELSVHQEISNFIEKDCERSIITKFVKILHKVKQNLEYDGLITTHDIYSFKISSEYGISDWLKDPLVKKEQKDFFRTFYAQKCRYIQNEDYPLAEFEIQLDECKYIGLGCLVASEMCNSIISLQTHELWLNEIIEGWTNTFYEEDDEIITKAIQLSNISESIHLANLEVTARNDCLAMVSSGQDLWEKREQLFPDLIFCESVKDQLYDNLSKFHIEQVAKKLIRLQEYFTGYDGVFVPKDLGFCSRTESETVKSNSDLKKLRLFEKPDGVKEYFYNHIGFTGNFCGRIHFLPDDTNRKCYIGYVGRHLRTKNF